MADRETVLRRLNWVMWIAIADAILLIPLIYASLTDNDSLVGILGPAHGAGFVALCALIGFGALEKLWSWWFLFWTIVTLGPLGSLVGEVIIRRRVKAAEPTPA